jgi:DedD protein
MREGAKQRLVGAAAVVALIVIFVPMLFERDSLDEPKAVPESIPPAPAFEPNLKSEVFLGPEDSGVGGLPDSELTDSKPLALPPVGDLEPAPTGGGSAEPSPPEVVEASPPGARPALAEPEEPAEPESAPPPARGANDGMPSWVIQVASVATAQGAAELEGKLRKGGFSAFVEKAVVNGKVYYRVRVGPELDRARAERNAAQLRERFKLNTLITSYP